MLPILLPSFLTLGLAMAPTTGQDLALNLAALEAPSAAERFAAERWLVAHLDGIEPEVLVDQLVAAGSLGQEARWRLGRALGSRPGNLGLALELLAGKLEPARTVALEIEPVLDPTEPGGGDDGWLLGRHLGRLALDQEIATWRAGLDRPPVSGAVLQLTLREERERHAWQPLEIADGPVAEVMARIAREGELPVPIVLAQGLAEKLAGERFGGSRSARVQPFRGPWDRVLFDFARAHGLAWEAVQYEGEAAPELAWLRLVPRGEEGVESGAAQLVRALEDLARRSTKDEVRAESSDQASVSAAELQLAARFLACIEWDAASAWLARLWLDGGDGMARSALLEAAARGSVEPTLATEAGVRRLLAYARSLASIGPPARLHRERLAAALRRLPKLGSAGGRLDEVLADGWQGDELSVRSLRLSGLAGMGTTSPGALELAREVLANTRGARAGEAALVALEVLAHAGGSPEATLGSPKKLLALVPDTVAPDELARRLALAGVALPEPESPVALLSPPVLRTYFMRDIYAGEFDHAAALLVGPSADGGLGLGEPGSWALSLEGGHAGRVFDELADALKGLLRGGELMATSRIMKTAGELAADANTRAHDPADLTSETLGSALAALPRLELIAGAMDPGHQAALLASLERAGDGSPIAADPRALGRLAAAPTPSASVARQRLLKLFAAALTSPHPTDGADVLPAIEDCLAALWARNADGEAEALVLDVATVAAGESSHPLAQEVLFRTWPPSPK